LNSKRNTNWTPVINENFSQKNLQQVCIII
jgi:hypothetical protein